MDLKRDTCDFPVPVAPIMAIKGRCGHISDMRARGKLEDTFGRTNFSRPRKVAESFNRKCGSRTDVTSHIQWSRNPEIDTRRSNFLA